MSARAQAKERAGKRKRGKGQLGPKNLSLSEEARKKLGTESVQTDQAEGEIVDWLICTHLKDWVVSYRGKSGESDQEDASAESLPVVQPATPSEGEPGQDGAGKGSGEAARRRRAS